MKPAIYALASVLLGMIGTPLWAANSIALPSLVNFETTCLKLNNLCRYIELDFSPNGTVAKNVTVFLPIKDPATAALWNRHQRARHSTNAPINVAIYDPHKNAWVSVSANKQCPWCVPDVLLQKHSQQWVRFKARHELHWRVAHSIWSFKRIVTRGEHSSLYVRVRSPDGPTVYASARSSGMHYHFSTRDTGDFGVILESSWVGSARPDYVVISPTRSWVDVAHAYMQAQNVALSGSNQLPTLTGTAEQIVGQAVHYIASQDIRYDAKLDAGGYPHETVSAILASDKTDCKGFTTLLYAILRKSGVASHPVIFNAFGMPPLSFRVPSTWSDHAILYVPAIGTYIDLTVSIPSHGEYTWQTSAAPYVGDVALDMATGKFNVVP